MGDDSFDYFKSWLVGRGERIFELALADPDALADEPSIDCESTSGELLGYAALDAYRAKFGPEMPDSYHDNAVYDEPDVHGRSPRGQRWREEELPGRFPRLWAKCGFD
jgi:hypothetical protein